MPGNARLLRDVQPELKLSWSSHRRSTEKSALQQVLLVEDIVDVELGTNQCAAEGKGESGASIQNEAGLHLDALVEIEETGAVGTITTRGIHAIGEARAINTAQARICLAQGICCRAECAHPLVVIEIEESLRLIGWTESAGDRSVAVCVID